MKVVVCVKQVPEITDVKVNPETGTLVREGIASILNPFCEYALDHAANLKSKAPDIEVIALTMGPPQAKAALYRCLELGADRAVLVSDRKFAGADTLATSYVLAAAIEKLARAHGTKTIYLPVANLKGHPFHGGVILPVTPLR